LIARPGVLEPLVAAEEECELEVGLEDVLELEVRDVVDVDE
jgi:hypothetical protein